MSHTLPQHHSLAPIHLRSQLAYHSAYSVGQHFFIFLPNAQKWVRLLKCHDVIGLWVILVLVLVKVAQRRKREEIERQRQLLSVGGRSVGRACMKFPPNAPLPPLAGESWETNSSLVDQIRQPDRVYQGYAPPVCSVFSCFAQLL